MPIAHSHGYPFVSSVVEVNLLPLQLMIQKGCSLASSEQPNRESKQTSLKPPPPHLH
jgi:hypothetical protein